MEGGELGLLVGETLRERLYGEKKQKLYFGLFILLRHRVKLRREEMIGLLRKVWEFFRRLVYGSVRIQVSRSVDTPLNLRENMQ